LSSWSWQLTSHSAQESASRAIGSCPRFTAAKSFRPFSSFKLPAASASARAFAARNLAASPLANDNRRERRLGAAAPNEGCGGAASASARAWAARSLAASPLPNDIRRERRLGAEPPVEGRDDAVLTVPQRTSSS